jgi:antitoxin component of MazEF toxin-antitoxin module
MSTYRTGSGSGELASRPREPRPTAYRKISRQGGSLMIPIPKQFLHALSLLKGDYVEMVLDFTSGRFLVKPSDAARQRAREARRGGDTIGARP